MERQNLSPWLFPGKNPIREKWDKRKGIGRRGARGDGKEEGRDRRPSCVRSFSVQPLAAAVVAAARYSYTEGEWEASCTPWGEGPHSQRARWLHDGTEQLTKVDGSHAQCEKPPFLILSVVCGERIEPSSLLWEGTCWFDHLRDNGHLETSEHHRRGS